MDVVLLSRIQFGLAACFHLLFPSLTMGLTLLIVIFESLHVKREVEIYKNISDFLIKIFTLVFILGTATGISLEFAFGTNWSNYSRMVGDIFGAIHFPNLVKATNDTLNLTIYNASSTELTLKVMLIIALLGMPLVFLYTFYIFKVFKGKINGGENH